MVKWLQILMLGLMVVLVALTGATTYRTWSAKTTESERIDGLVFRVGELEAARSQRRIKDAAMDDFCSKVLRILEANTWKTKTP